MKKDGLAVETWRDCHPGWGCGFDAPPQAPRPPGWCLWRSLSSLLPEISSCCWKHLVTCFFVSPHEDAPQKKKERKNHSWLMKAWMKQSKRLQQRCMMGCSPHHGCSFIPEEPERVCDVLSSASASASLQPFSNISSILGPKYQK